VVDGCCKMAAHFRKTFVVGPNIYAREPQPCVRGKGSVGIVVVLDIVGVLICPALLGTKDVWERPHYVP